MNPISSSYDCFIAGGPSVTIPATTYTVTYGNNAQIPCSVPTASPAVQNVQWTRVSNNGASINISMSATSKYSGYSIGNPTLTIFSTDNNDEGTYYCRASNSVGSNQDSAYLDVQGSKYQPIRNPLIFQKVSINQSGITIGFMEVSINQSGIHFYFKEASINQSGITLDFKNQPIRNHFRFQGSKYQQMRNHLRFQGSKYQPMRNHLRFQGSKYQPMS